MIREIGHIGIVVRDIEKSLKALSKIIKMEIPTIKDFPEKNRKCAVVEIRGLALEFLQDTSDDGLMAKFVREKGDSIHQCPVCRQPHISAL